MKKHECENRFFMDVNLRGISASRCTIRSICLILFLALLADAAPHILQPKHNGMAWINPCGVHHVEKTTVRHQANYFLRFLKEELKVTLHEFYKTRGRQKKVLPLDHRCMKIDYTKSITTDLTKSWKEYRMYKTENPNIIKKTPGILIHDWLSKFYERQMGFYNGFERLIRVKLVSESLVFKEEDRFAAIDQLKNRARSLLCEVETSLNTTGIPKDFVVKNIPSILPGNFPEKADVAGICTLDESFYALYQEFLKDWQKILNDMSSIKKERKRMQHGTRSLIRKRVTAPKNRNRQIQNKG